MRARPRMFGKVGGSARVADAVFARGQLQDGLRRLGQASRRRFRGVARQRKFGARAGNAIAVVEAIRESE